MRLSHLTGLGFNINAALDSGQYADVSVDTVKAEIEAGRLFEYLETTLGSDIDLSLYSTADRNEISTAFQELVSVFREGKKAGVRQNGLNLLLAYCLESIQRLPNR